jgi:hypothetical protein
VGHGDDEEAGNTGRTVTEVSARTDSLKSRTSRGIQGKKKVENVNKGRRRIEGFEGKSGVVCRGETSVSRFVLICSRSFVISFVEFLIQAMATYAFPVKTKTKTVDLNSTQNLVDPEW